MGWLDYGFRQYDPQLGRWHVQEPLPDKFLSFSPYMYALNDHINYLDILGLDTVRHNQVNWPKFKPNEDVIQLDEIVVTPDGSQTNDTDPVSTASANTASQANMSPAIPWTIGASTGRVLATGTAAATATIVVAAAIVHGDTGPKTGKVYLGTLPPSSRNQTGHNIVGLQAPGSDKVDWFDQTVIPTQNDGGIGLFGMAVFGPVSPAKLRLYEGRGLMKESKVIGPENYQAAAMAAAVLMTKGAQPYHLLSNSCVTNSTTVLGAAGWVAPPQIQTPIQLHEWFTSKWLPWWPF